MEIQKINDNIYYLVFIGSFGGVLLASAVIFFFTRYQRRFLQQQAALQKAELDHKQHLLYATIQSQEKERMRISKDLHDHIGSSLSNLRFVVSRIQNAGADENAIKELS
ncbi:MAG: histidine kinase, partial [Mucilaginibacter sp.]